MQSQWLPRALCVVLYDDCIDDDQQRVFHVRGVCEVCAGCVRGVCVAALQAGSGRVRKSLWLFLFGFTIVDDCFLS